MMSGMPRNRHRLPIDLARLRAPRSLGLTVAWRAGRRLDAGDIRMSESVADHLRSAVTTSLARVRESDLRAYGPDMHLETEEVLYVNDADLVSASGLGGVLFPDQPLRTISARTLPERPLVLYAVTFESAGEPVAFVRKTNPRKSAAAGRMLALLGNTLTGADKPVFTLDPSFDLIVTPGGVVALDQGVFELLFKETDAVLEAIPGWVEAIAAHLPLAGDGAALLEEKALTSSRLRRRLRAINERGHLAHVDIARVRAHIRALGLEEADFIDGDELVVDEADPMTLLELLNEDLFTGGLTDTGFRSERKSTRA
jgi:hypothetical protein